MDNHEHATHARHSKNFLAGLLFGGLAGAGAMLLLTPQSGKRTRTQIQRRSTELKVQATEAVDDAVIQTRNRVHRIRTGTRRNMEILQHRTQLMLEEQTARVVEASEAGKHTVAGTRESLVQNWAGDERTPPRPETNHHA